MPRTPTKVSDFAIPASLFNTRAEFVKFTKQVKQILRIPERPRFVDECGKFITMDHVREYQANGEVDILIPSSVRYSDFIGIKVRYEEELNDEGEVEKKGIKSYLIRPNYDLVSESILREGISFNVSNKDYDIVRFIDEINEASLNKFGDYIIDEDSIDYIVNETSASPAEVVVMILESMNDNEE